MKIILSYIFPILNVQTDVAASIPAVEPETRNAETTPEPGDKDESESGEGNYLRLNNTF